MAVKLTLLAAFIASMTCSSTAQRVCPSGYSPMCCMSGISPWYNSAGSFGGLCGFYPDDTSLPCAGRCSWTDGDCGSNAACCRSKDNSRCSIGIDCVYPAYPTHPSPDETVISTTTIGPSLSTSSTKFSSTTVVASTSILVSTSAAAPSSTPNSGPLLSDGWVSSYPCSVDPPSHVFNPPDVHQLSDNTPKSCTKFCDDRGYYFAGVMNGNECQCGNRYMGDVDPDAAPPAECEMPCSGDSTVMCGAGGRVLLYAQTGTVKGETYPPGWGRYAWCVADASGNGVFVDTVQVQVPYADFTPAPCVASCAARGFKMAGVKRGNECYCGNRPRTPERPTDEGPDHCTIPCPGAPGLTCGGLDSVSSDMIQLYSVAGWP